MIVLDTNVLSELMKGEPRPTVKQWVVRQPLPNLYTTTITQAEIMHGVMLLPAGRRRTAIEVAAKGMFDEDFRGRILPFDSAAALSYARITSGRQRAGRPIAAFDAQIAAIAQCAKAAVATRNVHDFDRCGIDLINPWES